MVRLGGCTCGEGGVEDDPMGDGGGRNEGWEPGAREGWGGRGKADREMVGGYRVVLVG